MFVLVFICIWWNHFYFIFLFVTKIGLVVTPTWQRLVSKRWSAWREGVMRLLTSTVTDPRRHATVTADVWPEPNRTLRNIVLVYRVTQKQTAHFHLLDVKLIQLCEISTEFYHLLAEGRTYWTLPVIWSVQFCVIDTVLLFANIIHEQISSWDSTENGQYYFYKVV